MIKYCGIALCALAAIIILRGHKSDFAGFVGLAASLIIFGAAVTAFIPVIDFVKGLMAGTRFGEYFEILFKAFGITMVIWLSSEACRDAGEVSMASKLELLGKAEILLLCIPLIDELFGLTSEILGL